MVAKYHLSISLPLVHPVRTYPILEIEKVLQEVNRVCSIMRYELLRKCGVLQMEHIQLSLFGKTSWELFHQITGWILKPCWSPSQIPKFQCLLLESEQMLEWSEGRILKCVGDSWMPDIGESPHSLKEEDVSSSWQILEENVPGKYYLKPVICNRFLRLAERAGCSPPAPV